jgi:hypothetical protein
MDQHVYIRRRDWHPGGTNGGTTRGGEAYRWNDAATWTRLLYIRRGGTGPPGVPMEEPLEAVRPRECMMGMRGPGTLYIMRWGWPPGYHWNRWRWRGPVSAAASASVPAPHRRCTSLVAPAPRFPQPVRPPHRTPSLQNAEIIFSPFQNRTDLKLQELCERWILISRQNPKLVARMAVTNAPYL